MSSLPTQLFRYNCRSIFNLRMFISSLWVFTVPIFYEMLFSESVEWIYRPGWRLSLLILLALSWWGAWGQPAMGFYHQLLPGWMANRHVIRNQRVICHSNHFSSLLFSCLRSDLDSMPVGQREASVELLKRVRSQWQPIRDTSHWMGIWGFLHLSFAGRRSHGGQIHLIQTLLLPLQALWS